MKKYSTKIILLIWVLGIIFITAGSLLPKVHVPEEYHLDKLIHGSAYAGLAFLAFFFTKSRKVFMTIAVLLIFLGGGIELLQTIVPMRDGTVGDFAADFIGVLCGAWIASKFRPLFMKWFKI